MFVKKLSCVIQMVRHLIEKSQVQVFLRTSVYMVIHFSAFSYKVSQKMETTLNNYNSALKICMSINDILLDRWNRNLNFDTLILRIG